MRDHPTSVMMFAAGFGTRMGALTANQPKPLIKVAGIPLIDHALDLVNGFGASHIVVNLHYKPKELEQHLSTRDVLFSHETPDILETGGGLRAARPLLGDGPVFTMNTDAVWQGPNPLTLLAQAWRPTDMDALLLCVPRDQARGHTGKGDFLIDTQGRATRGPGVIYTGAQIIKPDLLHDIPQSSFSLGLIWDKMIADGRLYVLPYPGDWCDVGQPESIAVAEAMLGYSGV